MCARRFFWLPSVCLFLAALFSAAICGAQEIESLQQPTESPRPNSLQDSAVILRQVSASLRALDPLIQRSQASLSAQLFSLQSIDLALSGQIKKDEQYSLEFKMQSEALTLLLAQAVTTSTGIEASLQDVQDLLTPLPTISTDMQNSISRLEARESAYRFFACAGIGGGIGALTDDWRGALWGALAGAIGDGVYELGHCVLKWW